MTRPGSASVAADPRSVPPLAAVEGVPRPLVEVRLSGHSRFPALDGLLEREGALAQLIACRLSDSSPRQLTRWLDVEAEPERTETVLRTTRRRLGPRHVAAARLGAGRLLLRVTEGAPEVCVTTHQAGGLCIACPLMTSDASGTWRVVIPRGSRAKTLLRAMPRGSACDSVVRVEPYRSRTSLTPRQDRALRIAYDLGYFAYPRRGSLGDVARSLGTGRSAALEILRRATGKLAGRRYGDELGGRSSLESHRRAPRLG